MSSLVQELQQCCLDHTFPTINVLRRALLVARKLEVAEFTSWIEKELNGYVDIREMPKYRTVHTSLQALNPYHGWVPIMMEDPEDQQKLCMVPLGTPIGSLEEMSSDPKRMLDVPLPESLTKSLMNGMGVALKPVRRINAYQVRAIVDAVRNSVLDWSLKLEEKGILGEGMTFSQQEKMTASHSNFIINYNAPVGTSAIQQGTTNSHQTVSSTVNFDSIGNFIAEAEKRLTELELKTDSHQQLTSDLQSVKGQLKAPNPSRVVLKECLKSMRTVLEGAVGNRAASGLLTQISPLIDSLNV